MGKLIYCFEWNCNKMKYLTLAHAWFFVSFVSAPVSGTGNKSSVAVTHMIAFGDLGVGLQYYTEVLCS